MDKKSLMLSEMLKIKDNKSINLKYKDITLTITPLSGHKEIFINKFGRGQFIFENPQYRLTTAPKSSADRSEKGDGALFLAITVKYCSTIYPDYNWTGNFSKWWDLYVCNIIKCTKNEDMSMITMEDFLKWAEMIDPTANAARSHSPSTSAAFDPTPDPANAARSSQDPSTSAAFDPTPDPANAARSSQDPSTSEVFDGDVYFDPIEPIEGGKRKSKRKKRKPRKTKKNMKLSLKSLNR
jgi:hypothetical protein